MSYLDMLDVVEIKKGDILDVASDLLSIMLYCRENNEKFDANKLIDRLKEKVGCEGTIMIRTFTWAFCRGEGFDYNKTPSEVGSLGNIAMKREDFVRTKHPIYSWMVWGKYQEELCNMDNVNSFGEDTPFHFLNDKGAKMLTIGNIYDKQNAYTYIHHIEQLVGVPYRFHKEFEGMYIDKDENKEKRKYKMYVRKLQYDVITKAINYEKYWIKMGYMEKKRLYNLDIKIYSLNKTNNYIFEDIKYNKGKKAIKYNKKQGGVS